VNTAALATRHDSSQPDDAGGLVTGFHDLMLKSSLSREAEHQLQDALHGQTAAV
jgi:uncharacterized membrane protein